MYDWLERDGHWKAGISVTQAGIGGAPLGEAPERGGGRPRDRVRVACSASQLAENNLMAPSSCRDLEQELWGWT